MKRSIAILALLVLTICLRDIQAQPIDNSSIEDKVICGYQGWFNCYGDGSPVSRWVHWSYGEYNSDNGSPAANAVTFEVYPDISGYSEGNLYQTDLADLGDGRQAKLFSSFHEEVVQQHFQWMEENGIDGVGLQRFIAETYDGVFKINRDSIAARVMRAAEQHNRIFYLMYDVSGFDGNQLSYLQDDWSETMVDGLQLTSSPAYAQNDGKPVICIWGIGFTHVSFNSTQSIELINWLKSNGYYVIGGVPTYWRTGINDSKPGFEEVYQAFDMISPWTVGRYGNIEGCDNYSDNLLVPDRDYCILHGMAYQPVLFPGFAWSNWNGGPVNEIPRAGGTFFWRQAYNIRQAGIPGAYIAMFDEYDEGTAIAPAADSYFSVPTDQYFLTYSADGRYFSADFYLRLAGEITRLIREDIPSDTSFYTTPSIGPILFRTSMEEGYDATADWLNTIDETTILMNVSGDGPGGIPACDVTITETHGGSYAIRLGGEDTSGDNSYCYYKVFDVDIPIDTNTYLSFWTLPENELGRHISLDLILSDGSNLRDAGAVDENGINMHPGTGRGTINQWFRTVCKIGHWLSGKTIDRIVIAYDYGPETGDFSAYIDDITIDNRTYNPIVPSGIEPVKEPVHFRIFPNPVREGNLIVDFLQTSSDQLKTIRITDLYGRLLYEHDTYESSLKISLGNRNNGVYLVTIIYQNLSASQKILLM